MTNTLRVCACVCVVRFQDVGGLQPDGEDLQFSQRRFLGARLLQQLRLLQTPQERVSDAADHVSLTARCHQCITREVGGPRPQGGVLNLQKHTCLLCLLCSDIHPDGLPHTYTLILMFRLLPDSPKEAFDLWQVSSSDHKPETGVSVDRKCATAAGSSAQRLISTVFSLLLLSHQSDRVLLQQGRARRGPEGHLRPRPGEEDLPRKLPQGKDAQYTR